MPRLAAAVAKAGQKALAAAGAAAPAAKSKAPAPAQAPSPQKAAAAPKQAPAPARGAAAPRAQATSSKRPAPSRTRVGEETDASADVYASLADAATQAADFVTRFQDLIAQLPPSVPLVAQGQKILSDFELLFGAPLEKGLSGEAAVGPATQGLIGSLQYLLDLQNESPPVGPWVWFARASAYVKLHPPAPTDPATAPGDPNAPPVGIVAKVVVSPATLTVTPGMPQAFSASLMDSAGNPVSPKAPLTWSVLPTGPATIDKDGNLTAQVQGALTVTATADGVSGTAAANSVAGQPLPPGGGGGGGGGDGGSSGGGGAGGSPPPSPGGYSPPGDDYEPPPEDEDNGSSSSTAKSARLPHSKLPIS